MTGNLRRVQAQHRHGEPLLVDVVLVPGPDSEQTRFHSVQLAAVFDTTYQIKREFYEDWANLRWRALVSCVEEGSELVRQTTDDNTSSEETKFMTIDSSFPTLPLQLLSNKVFNTSLIWPDMEGINLTNAREYIFDASAPEADPHKHVLVRLWNIPRKLVHQSCALHLSAVDRTKTWLTLQNVLVRKPFVSSDKGVALCGTVGSTDGNMDKIPSEMIVDWIEYHLRIGFELIWVYLERGDSKDFAINVSQMLEPNSRERAVFIDAFFPGVTGHTHNALQVGMEHSCLYSFRGGAKWLARVDIDEYLEPFPGQPSRSEADATGMPLIRRYLEGSSVPAETVAVQVFTQFWGVERTCSYGKEQLNISKLTIQGESQAGWPEIARFKHTDYIRGGREKLIMRPYRIKYFDVHRVVLADIHPSDLHWNPDPVTQLRINHFKGWGMLSCDNPSSEEDHSFAQLWEDFDIGAHLNLTEMLRKQTALDETASGLHRKAADEFALMTFFVDLLFWCIGILFAIVMCAMCLIGLCCSPSESLQ